MRGWIHTLVEDAHDLDRCSVHAIVDDMDGIPDPMVTPQVAYMEAADPCQERSAISCRRPFRVRSDRTKRGCQQILVASLAVCAPALEADREDMLEIRLRRIRNAKLEHAARSADASFAPWPGQRRQISIEVCFIDHHRVTAAERIDADLELCS